MNRSCCRTISSVKVPGLAQRSRYAAGPPLPLVSPSVSRSPPSSRSPLSSLSPSALAFRASAAPSPVKTPVDSPVNAPVDSPPPSTSRTANRPASRAASAAPTTVIPPRPGLAPWPIFSSKPSRPDSRSGRVEGSL